MNRRSSDLMKKMGSRNGAFDPEPPDQWLYNLNHADGPERGLAWIKSKTIAFQHDSPYAIDKQTRRPLKLADMAKDLGWAPQTARNVIGKLTEQGRAMMDEHGRICLCADVPLAHSATESGEETAKLENFDNFVQSYFSGYLADSVRALPAHLRDSFQIEYSVFAKEKRPKVFAEAAAQARAITDRYEDTILSKYALERIRLKKTRDPEPHILRLEMLDEDNFVQGFLNGANGHSVQSEKAGPYKPKNGSVQTQNAGASLFTSDTDTDNKSSSSSVGVVEDRKTTTTKRTPSPKQKPEKTSPTSLEIYNVVEATGLECTAAELLIAECRTRKPSITVAEILELWRRKFDQLRSRQRTAENFVGLMLTAVPGMVVPQ